MKSTIPNLFIIGAPKCGTTALANNLTQHKEIYLSKYKEPRYFDAHVFFDYKEDYPIKTLDEYLNLFNNEESKNKKYRLDSSVFNMYSEESIKNILELSPNAKFIVLLRDPVEASVSMHKQRLKYPKGGMRELSLDFLECWNMLEKRRENKSFPDNCRNKFLFRYDLLYSYEKYIPMLKTNINDENLFIGFYSDYQKNTELFFKNLFSFLDIENQIIINNKLNDSFILKESNFLFLLSYISKKTLLIRKKIGLSGNKKISQFRERIYSLYTIKKQIKDNDLSLVKDFFKHTYEYLEKLKAENK